ncbi:MAG: class I SAM-dependent methyltransferase [Bacteroidetes bacterium]|nr:class I SAM-dependent methyltransferase [Bacteroidota bacterium]
MSTILRDATTDLQKNDQPETVLTRDIFRFKYVSKLFIKGNLLDVGCRTGVLSSYLDKSIEYCGCDMFEQYQKFVKNFYLFNIEAGPWPIKDNSFDNIHIGEVLEHVSNFFFVFEEMSRILKPGGRIILTVPNNFGLIQSIKIINFKNYQRRMLDIKLVENAGTHIHCFYEADLLKISQLLNLKPIICDRIYINIRGIKLPEWYIFKPFATFISYGMEKYKQ